MEPLVRMRPQPPPLQGRVSIWRAFPCCLLVPQAGSTILPGEHPRGREEILSELSGLHCSWVLLGGVLWPSGVKQVSTPEDPSRNDCASFRPSDSLHLKAWEEKRRALRALTPLLLAATASSQPSIQVHRRGAAVVPARPVTPGIHWPVMGNLGGGGDSLCSSHRTCPLFYGLAGDVRALSPAQLGAS